MNYYLCNDCNGIVGRESTKKRVKSMCDESGNKDSVMVLIKNADELAVKLRTRYLENLIDLSSFKPTDRKFLEMAFEQGAKVVFNRLK